MTSHPVAQDCCSSMLCWHATGKEDTLPLGLILEEAPRTKGAARHLLQRSKKKNLTWVDALPVLLWCQTNLPIWEHSVRSVQILVESRASTLRYQLVSIKADIVAVRMEHPWVALALGSLIPKTSKPSLWLSC